MRYFLITLFLCAASAITAQSIPTIYVSVPDGISDDYQNGSMAVISGQDTMVIQANFKRRGATASHYKMKPAFTAKLVDSAGNELDTCVLGLRKTSSLIFDAAAIDRICMRNRVCFDIWNEYSKLPYDTDYGGRNGTEGRFAEIYINSEYFGIYCVSDKINRKLLGLKKSSNDELKGALYKSGTQDIGDQNTPGYFNDYGVYISEWHNAWELSYPDEACEAAWAPLAECFESGKTVDYVKTHFWLDNLAEYQVFIMALGISDNWGNKNRYVSVRNMKADGDNARLVVTPWDLDTGFGGDYKVNSQTSTYTLKTDFTPKSIVDHGGPYPFGRIQGDKEYKALLKEKWILARNGAMSETRICARLDSCAELFINSGAWDKMVLKYDGTGGKPYYTPDLKAEIEYIKSWYASRVKLMDEYFGLSDEDGVTVQSVNTQSSSVFYTLDGRIALPNYRGIVVSKNKKVLVRVH